MKMQKNIVIIIIIIIFIIINYLYIKKITHKYIYSIDDINLALDYIKGNIELDEKTFDLYDINKDNEVNVQDVVLINNIIKRRKTMNLIMLKRAFG